MQRLSTLEPCRLPSSPAMFTLFPPPLYSEGHWGASEEDGVARWKDYVREGELISIDVTNHAENAGEINGRHLNAQLSKLLDQFAVCSTRSQIAHDLALLILSASHRVRP